METETTLLYTVLALILGAAFVNGWTDAPNAIASAVVTRVMSPVTAVVIASLMNVLGGLFGTAVAVTLGKGIVNPDVINLLTIASALTGLIIWAIIAWWFGLPTSESHGLIAGFAGAAIATAGTEALLFGGWVKVGTGVFVAIVFGGLVSYLLARLVIRTAQNLMPAQGKKLFDRLQFIGACLTACSHGTGDGPKFAGIFTATLLTAGVISVFEVQWWVMFLCALAMGMGTMVGGWSIVSTMGKINRDMESWQGAASSFGSSAIIFAASSFGVPLSTTHTAAAALTGACASQSYTCVDWRQPLNIFYAAVLTFPLCGLIAFVVCLFAQYLFQ